MAAWKEGSYHNPGLSAGLHKERLSLRLSNTYMSTVCWLQTAASTTSSYFDSVETVPTTVLALKQALSQQVVVVLVDATHWSGYTGVRILLLLQECVLHAYACITVKA